MRAIVCPKLYPDCTDFIIRKCYFGRVRCLRRIKLSSILGVKVYDNIELRAESGLDRFSSLVRNRTTIIFKSDFHHFHRYEAKAIRRFGISEKSFDSILVRMRLKGSTHRLTLRLVLVQPLDSSVVLKFHFASSGAAPVEPGPIDSGAFIPVETLS